jgi:hypothetical protein
MRSINGRKGWAADANNQSVWAEEDDEKLDGRR